MTDPTDDAVLEAASAALDGEATDADRALLDADPGVAVAADAAVRAVRVAIAAPPPRAVPTVVETAIATALVAFDDRPAAVVPLVVPIARKSVVVRWLPAVAAFAAALLLVVGLTGALRGSDDRTTFAEVATTAGGGDTAAPAAGVAAPVAPSSPGTPPAVLDGGDVGVIDDPSALAGRIADALDGATDDTSTVHGGALTQAAAACAAAAPTVAPVPVRDLRWHAKGTDGGTAVIALAYDKADGSGRLLLLLAANGCALVTSEDF